MTLEQEAGSNDGMLRVPKIEFGIVVLEIEFITYKVVLLI
jgi:hypothetical protein